MSTRALLLIAALLGSVHAAAATRTDAVLMQGNRAGQQTVAVGHDGVVRAEYSYNDRDHGDHITATWTLDAAGIPVAERFAKGGKASWRNRQESGEQTLREAAFYMPANPGRIYDPAAIERALGIEPRH